MLRLTLVFSLVFVLFGAPGRAADVVRAALPPGTIRHVVVIDLENENFADTFGPSSPAVYLNNTLLPMGELVVNYYTTSHVSLGNYLSQVSGQATTPMANNDCIPPIFPLQGRFLDVLPGNDDPDASLYPGQVDGDGCVFPAPTATSHGATTIGDQLDARGFRGRPTWREYAEDMGDNPTRDGGTPDLLGGTDCAHPPIGGLDTSNSATATDQYATRHNAFVYFHSVIDDPARCAEHVVPLGKLALGTGGAPDTFTGHLAQDLAQQVTTPEFAFITPNLCNDGHDAVCIGPNAEGGHAGGLVAADLWLKHWMPLIFGSPAYKAGKMLVVITFDEATIFDARACCGEYGGPNISNPGFSPLVALFGFQIPPPPGTVIYPGGGQTGAVLLNARYIVPGSVNSSGAYNHFSALRSYEDLLGLTTGGDDGFGHLGFAGVAGLQPFGSDVFNAFNGRLP
jgi:hypothetical protein